MHIFKKIISGRVMHAVWRGRRGVTTKGQPATNATKGSKWRIHISRDTSIVSHNNINNCLHRLNTIPNQVNTIPNQRCFEY